MFIRKKEYEELVQEKNYAVQDRDRYERMSENWADNYLKATEETENQKKKVEELQKRNDELQHKIDILYAYYDIQKEPTQEERTKIRLDLRVHELEMENLELRANIRPNVEYLQNELNRLKIQNMVYNVPWPYCNANTSIITC